MGNLSNNSSSDGIHSRVVEGQTHDSLNHSPDSHSTPLPAKVSCITHWRYRSLGC